MTDDPIKPDFKYDPGTGNPFPPPPTEPCEMPAPEPVDPEPVDEPQPDDL